VVAAGEAARTSTHAEPARVVAERGCLVVPRTITLDGFIQIE